MNLTEFLASPSRNAWIREGELRVYVRKSIRSLPMVELPARTLDVANVSVEIGSGERGYFRELLCRLERLVSASPDLDGVYVENVVNKWLPDKLLKYGYVQVSAGSLSGYDQFVSPCFYKDLS